MGNQYKIIISNKNIYKEFELPETENTVRVGTGFQCGLRLHRDLFFETVELDFVKNGQGWAVSCPENLYMSVKDVRKLRSWQLVHGDELSVRYQSSDEELFVLAYMLDFATDDLEYDCAIDISRSQVLKIGGLPGCDIELKSSYARNEYIQLSRTGNGYKITELKTSVGCLVNGKRAGAGCELLWTDFLFVADYGFFFQNGLLYTGHRPDVALHGLRAQLCQCHSNASKYPLFIRNARIRTKVNQEKIEILDPPAPPSKPKSNVILKLAPSLAMLALIIVVRGFMSNTSNASFIIFSAASMMVGIFTSVFSMVSEKKEYEKEVRERIEKYERYIADKREQIAMARVREAQELGEIYMDPGKELEIVGAFSGQLFDREVNDEDFLCVRLGTGNVVSKRPVAYKHQERFETEDTLAPLPGQVAGEARYAAAAPLVVDLKKDGLIGLVGKDDYIYGMIKNMILDIAVRQYYKDVEIFLLISPEKLPVYGWMRWLPHLNNSKLCCRNIVCDNDSKNALFEYLYIELGRRDPKSANALPRLVIFVQDDWGIKNHPVSQFISDSQAIGAAFVFAGNYKEAVPQGCKKLVFLDSPGTGRLVDCMDCTDVPGFQYESVPDTDAAAAAMKLAPVYCDEISLENTLTKNITLYEMLGILSAADLDLESRWETSVIYKSMAAPLGVRTKNEIVYLDLHEKAHGPHGLVAGTTGSGKSEILQTYILSMATLYHPYEVGFMIIDFKGGGMANQFKELPHLIGTITNIDGREIQRSLQSIKAELQKRQRLFAQYEVNNINHYIQLYKSGEIPVPMPHLIIVVDEFAELKAEQPEFMKELISAARIGRSLGVHLILATQKPAGQVNEQIWSNSRFKLCLKVQTKEDSNEVIKSPLAAEIKEPGRAYMQVGNNELFVLFQSAYSGAAARVDDTKDEQEFTIYKAGPGSERKPVFSRKKKGGQELEQTQLTAIVNYIEAYCGSKGIERLASICLPPLPERISFTEKKPACGLGGSLSLGKITDGFALPVGIYDDPAAQYQGVAAVNISEENIFVIGASQTGKTNFVQLVLRILGERFSPEMASIYIMDFGSMTLKAFEKMNHVGGVVIAGEDEKLKNLFKLLKSELDLRKAKMLKAGVSSYGAYLEAGFKDMAQIVVILDNFMAFKELYGDEYEGELLFLCREGCAAGISFIVTNSQTTGFGYKYLSNFPCRLALSLNDNNEYSNVFERCRISPRPLPGRMLMCKNKEIYELQTYLAFEGEKEIDRFNAVRQFVQTVNESYPGIYAKAVPSIPEVLTFDGLEAFAGQSEKAYAYPLALDYATIDRVDLELGQMTEFAVIGSRQEQNLRVLSSILTAIHRKIFTEPVRLYIIDSLERPLKPMAELSYVEKYTIDHSAIAQIFDTLMPELEKRYETLMEEGLEGLSDCSWLFIVINNREVIEYISASKELMKAYNHIVRQYKALRMTFLFAGIEDTAVPYGAPELLKRLKEGRQAFITTGGLKDVKFCEIPSNIVRESRPLRNGDVYLLRGTSVQRIKIAEGE